MQELIEPLMWLISVYKQSVYKQMENDGFLLNENLHLYGPDAWKRLHELSTKHGLADSVICFDLAKGRWWLSEEARTILRLVGHATDYKMGTPREAELLFTLVKFVKAAAK